MNTSGSQPSTATKIIFALSFSHMLNDTMQALIPALYPLFKESLALSFSEVGLITLTFQLTSSLLQPLVGVFTDIKPQPYSLAIGMAFTLFGLILLSQAFTFESVLISAGMVGIGSSVFHPEASRMARAASGGKHGFAQSLFQVGGNFGTSLGPLLAAWIVVPQGQHSIAWFSFLAITAVIVLSRVGKWYKGKLKEQLNKPVVIERKYSLTKSQTSFAVGILIFLIISKFFYMVSLSNYYTFYLIHKFGVSIQNSQLLLFAFLFAVASGTYAGGPLGDRFGRREVIWFSILGVVPFTLIMPHVGLGATVVLSMIIGVILSSAFPAIIVFAQKLMPDKVGTVSGLFFGFAFGVSGVASALLGSLADKTGIEYVFYLCGYLPLIGLLAVFLPKKMELK